MSSPVETVRGISASLEDYFTIDPTAIHVYGSYWALYLKLAHYRILGEISPANFLESHTGIIINAFAFEKLIDLLCNTAIVKIKQEMT